MNKRVRPLLVVSPKARDEEQVRDYRPFGGRHLLTVLRDVAAGVSRYALREYDEYRVFTRFFFGQMHVDEQLIERLRQIPASVVDCNTYRNAEGPAVDAAKSALFHFASDGGKRIVLTCSDDCDAAFASGPCRAVNDDALFAFLWTDLCGAVFGRIGDVIARK